ncbi:MAG: Gx transporter family protein, partial [Lachnospiraceae bacterium]|nr:Gx transporter family protein [Lachnospiraceae bacterium]
SVAGALVSVLVMIVLCKTHWFHIPVVSASGGVAHNLGQVAVAFLVVESYGIVYYIPVLMISGLATGILIGVVATLVLPYIQTILSKGTL